jgi:hypothetical protein
MSPICSFGTFDGWRSTSANFDHEVEDVRLVHLLDLGFELEVLEDALDVRREALDVADQVLVDVVRVALQLREVERRVVVEALARDLVQRGVERLARELAALVLLVRGDDLGLGPGEDAVEAPQHRHRQHHALVLRRAVRAAQQVGDLPDEVCEAVVISGHRGCPDRGRLGEGRRARASRARGGQDSKGASASAPRRGILRQGPAALQCRAPARRPQRASRVVAPRPRLPRPSASCSAWSLGALNAGGGRRRCRACAGGARGSCGRGRPGGRRR